jgi:prophage regulatory protein
MAGTRQSPKPEQGNLNRSAPRVTRSVDGRVLGPSETRQQSIASRATENNLGDRLLDRRSLEERTSLDITTIYRKIKQGTFPHPLRVGRRRSAWRESDIAAWQNSLEVGVRKG